MVAAMRLAHALLPLLVAVSGCIEADTPAPRGQETPPAPTSPSPTAEAAPKEPTPAAKPEAEPGSPGEPEPDGRAAGWSGAVEAARLQEPEPVKVQRQQAGVDLLEPGAEPRKALVLSVPAGAEQTLELSMASTVALEVGDQKVPPTPIPTMTVVFDTRVEKSDEKKARGTTAYTFETVEARRAQVEGASARMLSAVDKALQGLEQAKGRTVIAASGRTLSQDLALPAAGGVGPQPSIEGFRQSFSQLFVVLPEEPIGKGAKWKAISHFESSGVPIQQTATYELLEVSDTQIEVGVVFEQAATTELGQRELPGGTIDLGSFAAVGEGTLVQRLDRVAPERGESHARTKVVSTLKLGGGQGQPLITSMDLDLKIATVELPSEQ